jgi:hypothetical protein
MKEYNIENLPIGQGTFSGSISLLSSCGKVRKTSVERDLTL